MIGSLLTRGLVMVLGYAYPAFECYKTVEKNKPGIEELRFWCQYWILVAMLTVTERIGDVFISWVPMYSEAKLAFYIYLWYPKTRGTSYVYNSFFKPYMAKHETEIDRSLLELRTRAGDMVLIYWQRAASCAQTRIFDILQFVAAQSTLRTRSAQQEPEQIPTKIARTTSGTSRQALNAQPEAEEPQSPTSSTSSSHHSEEVAEVAAPVPKTAPSATLAPKPNSKSAITVHATLAETSAAAHSKSDPMETDQTFDTSPEDSKASPTDIVMEETLRVTRAKLRKNRSMAGTAT
ncbi:unnamed protein product [Rhodiola kirilowii]